MDVTTVALNKSAVIITCFLGKRSVQTPAKGAKITADKMRAPRIRPSDEAPPPASKTVTARAIGKADEPTTKIALENQKSRYPLYDQREPGSNSFTKIKKYLLLCLSRCKNLIDNSVFNRFGRGKDLVPLNIFANFFGRFCYVTS